MSDVDPSQPWTVEPVEVSDYQRRLAEFGQVPYAVALFGADPVLPDAFGLIDRWDSAPPPSHWPRPLTGAIVGDSVDCGPEDTVRWDPATGGMVIRRPDGSEAALPGHPAPWGESLPGLEP